MKSTIFWDITPCSPLKINRHRLHLQGPRISRERNYRKSRWQAELWSWTQYFLLPETGAGNKLFPVQDLSTYILSKKRGKVHCLTLVQNAEGGWHAWNEAKNVNKWQICCSFFTQRHVITEKHFFRVCNSLGSFLYTVVPLRTQANIVFLYCLLVWFLLLLRAI
jgi:hypothetical protein